MKNLLLLFILTISTFSFPQGTLQFNQVKLVSSQETVPQGKVWKIESVLNSEVSRTATFTSNCTGGIQAIKINGKNFYFTDGSPGSGSSIGVSSPSNKLPFWLPAGSIIQVCTSDIISIIEFNIIP